VIIGCVLCAVWGWAESELTYSGGACRTHSEGQAEAEERDEHPALAKTLVNTGLQQPATTITCSRTATISVIKPDRKTGVSNPWLFFDGHHGGDG
jgi:hypothetical protein